MYYYSVFWHCSTCSSLLQFCVVFTIDGIFILDIRTVLTADLNRRRQVRTTTLIAIAAEIPIQIPVINNRVPLIPPTTLIQVFSNNTSVFESITGLTVTGNPVAFFTPIANIPVDFGKIAVIVLPIVVTVLVLALIGGIAAILLIV